MSFSLREHTADVAIEATGATLGAVFAETANGLAAAHIQPVPPGEERFEVAVSAENREALLFEYLDELIYQRDVRNQLPVENSATVTEKNGKWELAGVASGAPIDDMTAREVKAVTYSDMSIKTSETGWRAYVVVDI